MLMHFDARHVLDLLDLAESRIERRYTFEQLVVSDHLRDDLPETRRQAIEGSRVDGISLETRPEDLDPRKVPPGLILVGDQGVYLLANVPHDIAVGNMTKKGGHVAYARECDPNRLPFETWYAAKRDSFGGDDGAEFLEGAGLKPLVEACIRAGEPFCLDVTPESIRVLTPKAGQDPSP